MTPTKKQVVDALRDLATERYGAEQGQPSEQSVAVGKVISKGHFGCMSASALRLMTYLLGEPIARAEGVPVDVTHLVVVPLSNPNGHYYTVGQPVFGVNPTQGLMTFGLLGNNLPVNRAGDMRIVEYGSAEFEEYFQRLLDTEWVESRERIASWFTLVP